VSKRFTVIDAAELPDDVRKECCGDHAWRTAVVWDHEHDVLIGTDHGEIEDLSLFRDLSWVVDAMNSVSAERDAVIVRAKKAEARVAALEAALTCDEEIVALGRRILKSFDYEAEPPWIRWGEQPWVRSKVMDGTAMQTMISAILAAIRLRACNEPSEHRPDECGAQYHEETTK